MQSHIGTHTLVTHTGEKKFKCPNCEQLYSSAKLLVEHIQNNHKREEIGQIRNASLEAENTLAQEADKESGENKKRLFEDPIINRNKANIDSDDEGSDTSADESDDEEKPTKGTKQSFSCPYCKDPKTAFTTRYVFYQIELILIYDNFRDALDNHQKDIFGLDKTEKFFTRPKLQCEQCNYRVGCESTMANHMKIVHKTHEAKCDICPFKSHLKAILLHHVANEHR